MPGQFIRTAVLGLPSERPEFSPDELQGVWMPVISGAQHKEDLSFGNVVMASLPEGIDLTAGIDLAMLRKQMKSIKLADALAWCKSEHVRTVSYTHLDVYKRQV